LLVRAKKGAITKIDLFKLIALKQNSPTATR
jgi:hypothetical protein